MGAGMNHVGDHRTIAHACAAAACRLNPLSLFLNPKPYLPLILPREPLSPPSAAPPRPPALTRVGTMEARPARSTPVTTP